MDEDFSQRFEIIYQLFLKKAPELGLRESRLAFAGWLGISQGRMQKWEKGQIPRAPDLMLIKEKLGVSIDWLVTGSGEPVGLSPEETRAALLEENQRLQRELESERALTRKLTARMLVDGVGDKDASHATAKAAGQE